MKVKRESEVAQSCPTLSDPMDGSLPGSSIHGIFQARVLEWGAIRNYNTVNQLFVSVCVKVTQSCPTLCNPMDYTIHGILQARILEWGAFPFSRGSSQPRDRTQVSYIAGGFYTS